MGIYGQDWASYQSTAPDTSGLSFAFTKITEGLSYENPKWVAQRDHAKANGLVWGGYHYPHMGNSVQAEADYFLSKVAWKPGDLVALDWEGYDTANKGVPLSMQRAYKESWLRYVKSKLPHNPVGMYANTDYWRRVDTTGFFGDFLWIATAGLPAGQPGIQAPWLFHQYGASGVDRDYCHLGTTAELRAWARSFATQPQPTPTPPEPDMAITDADAQKVAMAVLTYKNADAAKKNPQLPDVYGYIAGTNGAVASLTAQVGALSGAITALTKAGGITAEQVQAAAEAGAKAALDELAHAIGNATA